MANSLTASTLGITDQEDLGQTPYASFLSSVQSLGKNASPIEIVKYMRGKTGAGTPQENTSSQVTTAEARRSARRSEREQTVLTRSMQPQPLPALSGEANPRELLIGGYQGVANAQAQTSDARRILAGQALEAVSELSGLGELNREEYKRQKRSELNPTEGIDQDILDIRNKALVGRAALMEQVRNLPFEMQNRLIAQHGAMFGNALQKLMDLRQTKLDAVDSQSDEEFDAYSEKVRNQKAKIDGLKTALDFMEAQGETNESMAQLRIDLAKELERLNKTKTSTGDLTSNEDLIFTKLLEQHKKVYGTAPNSDDRAFYKTQAKQISSGAQGMESGTLPRSALAGVMALTGSNEIPSELYTRSQISSTVGKPDAGSTLVNINRILGILDDPNTPDELKIALQGKLRSAGQ